MLGGRAEKYLSLWGNNNELVIDKVMKLQVSPCLRQLSVLKAEGDFLLTFIEGICTRKRTL